MIHGFIHPGSGLGNQLHRYVATRVLAVDKGYHFSMIGRKHFKGGEFMDLDFGSDVDVPHYIDNPAGKIIPHVNVLKGLPQLNMWEEKTSYYNPEFNFISNNTIVDGEFQSIQYFGHLMDDIDEWLKVEPIDIPDDVCIIGFRGGEFYVFPELGLPPEYFAEAKALMLQENINMKFEVHTDDPVLAKQFFPDYKVIHDIGVNWRSIRYAKYAIIANSSFYILPRLLKHFYHTKALTIAPRFWARRNIGEWSRPDNFYRAFKYI